MFMFVIGWEMKPFICDENVFSVFSWWVFVIDCLGFMFFSMCWFIMMITYCNYGMGVVSAFCVFVKGMI